MEIEFFANAAIVKTLLPPVPAAAAMPKWWLNAQRSVPNTADVSIGSPDAPTFKVCQPFTDVLRTGYIIPLWQDIAYSDTSEYAPMSESRISLNWGRGTDVVNIDERLKPIETKGWDSWSEIEGVEEGLINGTAFSFISPWTIRTPPGYSCLFTSPLNSEDSRLRLFAGIVNTDTYFNSVNFFFGIRKNTSMPGVFKKGMPLVQVIPFKREEWTSSVTPINMYSEEYNIKQSTIGQLNSHLQNGYKIHHGCPIKFK